MTSGRQVLSRRMFVVATCVYSGLLAVGTIAVGVYYEWSTLSLIGLAFGGLLGIFGGAVIGHRLIVCPMCQEAIYSSLLREQVLWFWVLKRVKACPHCHDDFSSDAERNAAYWQRQSTPVMRGEDHSDITRGVAARDAARAEARRNEEVRKAG